ncbi:MFS transporter [Lacticaseibacillus jixiensis]|uniref:MFS transporter n=1 Tax=Lacticaseibacillus jixiensis TaxID=3231926 RepID=UPI0036F34FFF
MKQNRTRFGASLTLLALAISAFAIGMTEFISVGVMPLIVNAFGVDLSTAGLTVSAYAAGIMVGAPLLTAATARLPRKQLLLAVMVTFVVGNLVTASAPSFAMLLIGRVIAALAHGLFMAVATVIAANVVTVDRRASAIATIFTGLTVATVTGVPLGTFIAQHASWRVAFGFIAALGLVALVTNSWLVPNDLPLPTPSARGGIGRLLRNPRIRAGLVITALGYGASFPVYTYLGAILTKQGWSSRASVWILLGYGAAVAVGNSLGGRLSNLQPLRALSGMFGGLTMLMLIMAWGIHDQVIGLVLVILLGLLAFMNVPGLQLLTMQIAEDELPADAQLASALNISGFNVGIMIGSFAGGQLLTHWGLWLTPLGGIAMGALALIATLRLRQANSVAETCSDCSSDD